MENDKKQQYSEEEITRQRYLKMSPFNAINNNIQYTACVGINGGYNQSTIYEGFKSAVDTLIESIGKYNNYSDPLVYPILFCIRHSIELFLKDLYNSIQYIKSVKDNNDSFVKLNKARRILSKLSQQRDYCDWIISHNDKNNSDLHTERNKKRRKMLQKRLTTIQDCIDLFSEDCFKDSKKEEFTHNLNELIQKITSIYHIDIRIKELFDEVLPILSYYKDIDPNGDAFRYWSDKDGKPHFETKEIDIVKIDIIAVQFEEITKLFSQIDWLMWYLKKEYNTGTFTKDLSRAQLEEISKLLPLPNEFTKKIKQVKEKVKKKYNVGSNKFNYALEIIRRHREFSSYMAKEKVFSCLSDATMKIFAECSLGQRNWEESSSKISINELSLLFTFSDISGWRYAEGNYVYFSEDLEFLYSETKKRHEIGWHDINPASEINHVIKGMKKCGQITYAEVMEGYILKTKGQ
ncbi:hypothetical protein KTC96_11405 [Clostridium estertheticum]|uniref:hypothetical protein n=1 Tax=Clostridium estertheticum TaxID=238834 RepID=UPI001C7DC688|nr:hypothetical protein [Clostridium estertheticum]MBX4261944.1 hypothetical protein [Clostridium estertheticum]WLC68632.1 hypothetical protein KTC96_11405 [Clostridium estertheticum]